MKKPSGGGVHVKAHIRAGKRVKSYVRGSGGALHRTAKRRGTALVTGTEMKFNLGNYKNKSFKNLLKEHINLAKEREVYGKGDLRRAGGKYTQTMNVMSKKISASAARKIDVDKTLKKLGRK